MRLNKYIALSTGLSRRAADHAIEHNRVTVNGGAPSAGQQITPGDIVTLDGIALTPATDVLTVMLNKPVGFVCSRDGQGSRTIYDLLPHELHRLKPVGRLDKNSSGLLLLTNDGALAQELTHPKYQKTKVYEIAIDKPLAPLHHQMINDNGINLEDGPSKLALERISDGNERLWHVTMREGRNRQIRRTFAALGYEVTQLNRVVFGNYRLGNLAMGAFKEV
jgi:23S rRNA pseudouridine2605 synthase